MTHVYVAAFLSDDPRADVDFFYSDDTDGSLDAAAGIDPDFDDEEIDVAAILAALDARVDA